MATETDTLKLKIEVDSKTGKLKVTQFADTTEKAAKKTKKSTDKMSDGFAKLWKKIALGATAVIALKNLVSATAGFEESFANLTTLIPTGTANLADLEAGLLSIAGELGSVEELTNAAYDAISGGVEPARAVEFLSSTAAFAKANMVEMSDATDVVTTVLNTYGERAGNAATITDILTTTIRLGKTRGAELAATFGQIAGTANVVGISFQDLNAAVIALTAGGVKTSQAMTSLKAIIANIAQPTDQAKEAAEGMAGGFSLASLKSQGLATFLQNMTEHVAGNVQAQKDLFGSVEAFNAIAVLTSDTGLKKFTEAQIELGNSANATREALDKQQQSAAAAFATIKNEVEAAMVKVFLPVLKDMVTWLKANKDSVVAFAGSAVTAFTSVAKALTATISKIVDLAGGLKGVAIALSGALIITKIAPFFLVFIKGLRDAITYFRILKMEGLTTTNALAGGFTAVTGKLGALSANVSGLKGAVSKIGPIAAAGFTGWQIGRLIGEMTGLDKAVTNMYDNMINKSLSASIAASEAETGVRTAIGSQMDEIEAIRKVAAQYGIKSTRLRTIASEIQNVDGAYDALSIRQRGILLGLDENTKKLKEVTTAIKKKKEAEAAAIVISEEQIKIYEETAKSLGVITKDGYGKLIQQVSAMGAVWKKDGDQIARNYTLSTTLKGKIDELIESFKTVGKDAPKSLKELNDEFRDMYALTVPAARVISDMGIDLFPKAAQNAIKLESGIEKIGSGAEKTKKKVVSLGTKLESLSGLLSGIVGNLAGIGAISESTAQSLSGITSGIAGVGSGIEQFQNAGDGLLGVLGKIGGAVGIAASAISTLKGIIGLLAGDSGELEAARRRMSGLPGLTRDWTEDIEKLAQELGGAGSAARAFNQMLPDIIRDSNITINTFDAWIVKVREIVSSYEQGTASIYETQTNFGAAFDAMREKAVELGIEGSRAMIGLILEAEEFGLDVKEISEYTSSNMVNATKGWMQVLEQMGGVSVPILDEQVRQLKLIESIPPGIATEIEGATAALVGLSNISELLPEDFAQFGLIVEDVSGKLEAQGVTGADAALAMKPLLERIIFLSQEYGYTVDEGTQALIDQGVAAGHLSTDIRSDGEKQIAIQEKMLGVLERIEKGFFGISDAVGEFGRTGEKVFFHMDNAATGWKKTMQDVIDTTEDATDAIANMGGTHDDVMFGHSIVPDIETWIDKLDDVTSSLDGDVAAAIQNMGSVYSVVSSGMYADNEELQAQLTGMIDDIRDIYSQAGAELFSKNYAANAYEQYGIYNPDPVADSMKFEELKDLWYSAGGELVQDSEGFAKYVEDLKNLTVADELQDDFTWFISEMDKWQERLEAGDIWDVESQSWIVPEKPTSYEVDTESLSDAFSGLMAKAKSFGLEGTAAMIDLMETSKSLGINVQEIEAYQKSQMKSAADGWRKVLAEFDGATLTALNRIIGQEDRLASLPEGLRGEIDGATQALEGMSNARKLTAGEFEQFELVGLDMMQKLADRGIEGKNAIPMMSDFLERMNMLSQEYGYDLDPAIQALIDTGLESGMLSDDIRTDTQKSVTLQEEMVSHLSEIAAALGAEGYFEDSDIPGFALGTGGMISPPDRFIVGEQGPEFVETSGSMMSITPIGERGVESYGQQQGGKTTVMEFNMYITAEQGSDPRKLADAIRYVFEYNTDNVIDVVAEKVNER